MKINLEDVYIKKVIEHNELEEYLKLTDIVKDKMLNKEWLYDYTKEEYIQYFKNEIHIFGAYFGNKIIAAGVLGKITKKDLEEMYLNDLDFNKTIDFGTQVVHPNYRGNGLQDKIIKFLEKEAVKLGYEFGVATAHPDNKYSIKNLANNGFEKIVTTNLYFGIREIYRKKLI